VGNTKKFDKDGGGRGGKKKVRAHKIVRKKKWESQQSTEEKKSSTNAVRVSPILTWAKEKDLRRQGENKQIKSLGKRGGEMDN